MLEPGDALYVPMGYIVMALYPCLKPKDVPIAGTAWVFPLFCEKTGHSIPVDVLRATAAFNRPLFTENSGRPQWVARSSVFEQYMSRLEVPMAHAIAATSQVDMNDT